MTSSLRSRFLSAEQALLSAFAAGSVATSAFEQTWSELFMDFTAAVKLREVDASTISLAHTIASRIAILAGTLVSLETESDRVVNSFSSSCARILSSTVTSDSMEPVASLRQRPPTPPPPSTSYSSTSPYRLAHAWLLQNLHDPYPPNTVKQALAQGCHCSITDIQTWFSNARREIGWTALLCAKFGGSRHAMSAAASQVYAVDGNDDSLPFDLMHAFQTIKLKALDLDADSSAHQIGASQDVWEKESPWDKVDEGLWPDLTISPNSPVSEEEQDDTVPPPPIAGFKRRSNASMDATDEGQGHVLFADHRPPKRCRFTPPRSQLDQAIPTTSTDAMQKHTWSDTSMKQQQYGVSATTQTIPGTYPSLHACPSINASTVSGQVTSTPISTLPPVSRKRRLSDSALSSSSKRPRGLFTRPQVVSDPLPFNSRSSTLEIVTPDSGSDFTWDAAEWLETGDPASSTLDVQQPMSAELSGDAGIRTGDLPHYLHISDADLAAATSDGFDFSTSEFADQLVAFTSGSNVFTGYVRPDDSCSTSSMASVSDLMDDSLWDSSSSLDSNYDWSQIFDAFTSSSSSPASSQSSLSDCMAPSYYPSAIAPPLLPTSISKSFGVNPSFTCGDVFSDISQLSSLAIPLEATF